MHASIFETDQHITVLPAYALAIVRAHSRAELLFVLGIREFVTVVYIGGVESQKLGVKSQKWELVVLV